MAFRLYVLPVITTGNLREPKYFTSADPDHVGWWAAKDYGMEPWMLIGADISGADDVALTANADVLALPFDLSPTLTAGQVTTVQTKLEAANIPAGWVTTALTWAQIVRVVCHIFEFFQRFCYLRGIATGSFPARVFAGGVTLSTTFGSLSAGVRATIADTATSLGLDGSGITAGTTLRVLLKAVADQMASRPVVFNGIEV